VSEAAPTEERWAKTSRGGTRRLLVWLVVLGLVGLVAALLSERNANSFSLALVDGALVVKKGVFFPVGSRAYAPPDPKLAPAYAPLAPPPGTTLPEEQTFPGRVELDQALFELLARWAKADVESQARDRIARAMGYVARAELLPGVSMAQRQELDRLRAEAGFYEGRDLVGRAMDELRQARERLERTARSTSPHAGEASGAVRDLDASLEALHRAGRALGSQQQVPSPPPSPPQGGGDGASPAPAPTAAPPPAPTAPPAAR
jgi:hypothetical protein